MRKIQCKRSTRYRVQQLVDYEYVTGMLTFDHDEAHSYAEHLWQCLKRAGMDPKHGSVRVIRDQRDYYEVCDEV